MITPPYYTKQEIEQELQKQRRIREELERKKRHQQKLLQEEQYVRDSVSSGGRR